MRKSIVVITAVLLLCSVAIGQQPRKPAQAEAKDMEDSLRQTMRQVWDAWETLKAENAAKFYSQDPKDVFFDIAPLKNQGWNEYVQHVAPMLTTFKSMKSRFNDDLQVHLKGDLGWTTTTIHADVVGSDGRAQAMEIRWTAIWQRKAQKWLIVHEHVSVPSQ